MLCVPQDHIEEEEDYYDGEDLDLARHSSTIAIVNKTLQPSQPVTSERDDALSRVSTSSSSASTGITGSSTAYVQPEVPPVVVESKIVHCTVHTHIFIYIVETKQNLKLPSDHLTIFLFLFLSF